MCCLGTKNSISYTNLLAIRNMHQIINKIIDYLLNEKLINKNEVDKIVKQVFKHR